MIGQSRSITGHHSSNTEFSAFLIVQLNSNLFHIFSTFFVLLKIVAKVALEDYSAQSFRKCSWSFREWCKTSWGSAGPSSAQAGNKLNRVSHNRWWSYVISWVVRFWINEDFFEANSYFAYFAHLLCVVLMSKPPKQLET